MVKTQPNGVAAVRTAFLIQLSCDLRPHLQRTDIAHLKATCSRPLLPFDNFTVPCNKRHLLYQTRRQATQRIQ